MSCLLQAVQQLALEYCLEYEDLPLGAGLRCLPVVFHLVQRAVDFLELLRDLSVTTAN